MPGHKNTAGECSGLGGGGRRGRGGGGGQICQRKRRYWNHAGHHEPVAVTSRSQTCPLWGQSRSVPRRLCGIGASLTRLVVKARLHSSASSAFTCGCGTVGAVMAITWQLQPRRAVGQELGVRSFTLAPQQLKPSVRPLSAKAQPQHAMDLPSPSCVGLRGFGVLAP